MSKQTQKKYREIWSQLCKWNGGRVTTGLLPSPSGSVGHQLPGRYVSGGGGPVQSQLFGGGDSVFHSTVQGSVCASNQSAVHERVAETMSATKPDAAPLRGGMSAFPDGISAGTDRGVIDFAAYLFSVLTAVGGLQTESAGPCSATCQSQETIQEFFSTAPSNGVGCPIPDTTMGRDDGVGSGSSAFLGSSAAETPAAGPAQQRQPGLYSDVARGERVCGWTVDASQATDLGGAASVSPATRGCVLRCGNAASNGGGDTKQGAMADSQECEELRERIPSDPAVQRPAKRNPARRNKGQRKNRQRAPQPALSVCVSLAFAVFLEIFSGGGGLGKAVSNHCGWPVLLWDISFGAEYDLTKTPIQQMVVHWIRSGKVRAGHLGTPCNSFSRARDRPGGPPRLRSDKHPMGLPGLAEHLYRKVRDGNVLMRFSCWVLRLAISLHIPFTLENPHRSRLWICPPVLQILRRKVVVWKEIHFCAFGTPWKKPTRILRVHISLDILDWCRCLSSKRGICNFSGKPHVPLAGQDSNGRWMTKIAEPYPPKLTKLLAVAFANEELSLIATEFSRFL